MCNASEDKSLVAIDQERDLSESGAGGGEIGEQQAIPSRRLAAGRGEPHETDACGSTEKAGIIASSGSVSSGSISCSGILPVTILGWPPASSSPSYAV